MSETTHIMPHNRDAEEHVLGAILIGAQALRDVSEILQPQHFYLKKHRRIYEAALALADQDQPVDTLTIADELGSDLDDIGGRARLHELVANATAASNAVHHANIVRDLAIRRDLITTGQNIARSGWEPTGDIRAALDDAESSVYGLTIGNVGGDLELMRDSLDATYADLEKPGGLITGTPVGLRDLDVLTAGLQPGNLVVVAARPGMGKSAIAITAIIHNAVQRGAPVALFTLEMSKQEINMRVLSQVAAVDLQAIRTRQWLTERDRRNIADARPILEAAPIYQDDTASLLLTDIRSRARRLKARHPDLSLVIVDYLQLMVAEQKHENRNQEIAHISRGLKILSRQLDTPVMALAQLNRGPEMRSDKRPLLSDLRDSGAIEQDSDIVLFLYRDDYYHGDKSDEPGVTEIIVAKHRNGPTGLVKTIWVKERAEFQSIPKEHP